MRINCVDRLPAGGEGYFLHFRNEPALSERWTELDVMPTIRANEKRWFDQIQTWHGGVNSVGVRMTQWWWCTAASRLISWLPPIFENLFLALGIIELCERNALTEIYLVGYPAEVSIFLRELRPDVAVVDIEPRVSGQSLISGSQPSNFAKFLKFIRHAFTARRPPQLPTTPDLLVCSIFLGTNSLSANGDHFFGRMLDGLPQSKRAGIHWLYSLGVGDLDSRADLKAIAKDQGRAVSVSDEYLTPLDVVRIIAAVMALIRVTPRIERAIPALVIDGMESRRMGKKFLGALLLGQLPIGELKCFFAMKRILARTSPRGILFPFEEKGLERALLRAHAETRSSARTMGFAHAVYHAGHRYLLTGRDGSPKPPRPEFVLTTGVSASEWLVTQTGIERRRIREVGSPRFKTPFAAPARSSDVNREVKVLFISSAHYEIGLLARFARDVPNLFADCILKVRLYPFDRIEEQNRGVELLIAEGTRVETDAEPLGNQLEWAEVVLFCSTSAGLESMLSGRLTVHVDLNAVFTLDILTGKGDLSVIDRCASAHDLARALSRIGNLTPEEYERAVEKQVAFARAIYSPPVVDRIYDLLD